MSTIINASNSSGLVFTSDTSGSIQLQSLGTTIATVQPSGFSYSGGVLQVVQAVKSNTQSTTSVSAVDVTGLSVSITPKFSTSKILVLADVGVGISSATSSISFLWLVRNSTNIYVGDAAGSRGQVWMMLLNTSGASDTMFRYGGVYLDSPATTNATTYKVQFNTNNGANPTYINQSAADANQTYVGRTASSITVMEIAV